MGSSRMVRRRTGRFTRRPWCRAPLTPPTPRDHDATPVTGTGAPDTLAPPPSHDRSAVAPRGPRARNLPRDISFSGSRTYLLPWGCQTIMELALEAVVVVTAATLATTGATAERAAILKVVWGCGYEGPRVQGTPCFYPRGNNVITFCNTLFWGSTCNQRANHKPRTCTRGGAELVTKRQITIFGHSTKRNVLCLVDTEMRGLSRPDTSAYHWATENAWELPALKRGGSLRISTRPTLNRQLSRSITYEH